MSSALLDNLDVVTATAAVVLADARALKAQAESSEAGILRRACDWADLHPAVRDSDTAFDDDRLPRVTSDATAEFALALGMSHEFGTSLVHEALELRHRLPRVWARTMLAGNPGGVPAWRARRIAQATLGKPDDVADHVDRVLARVAHKVGPVTTSRLLDEAMLRLYPEQHEVDQIQALDNRHASMRGTADRTGVGYFEIAGDLKDLLEFSDTLSEIARALAEQGCVESLDVRRSLAVGVLSDPQGAADLLASQVEGGRPRKQLVLYVHLSHAAIAGLEPVGRCERGNQAVLEQQIRGWCGRSDTHLRVQPVIDLNDHEAVGQYEIPDRIRTRVSLRDHHCVFPWCTRPARSSDCDHVIAHGVGGATCTCNLAPLCRRHHRLKTLTRWGYSTVEPGIFHWISPGGRHYLRDHTGTLDVTRGTRGTGEYDGCREPRPDG